MIDKSHQEGATTRSVRLWLAWSYDAVSKAGSAYAFLRWTYRYIETTWVITRNTRYQHTIQTTVIHGTSLAIRLRNVVQVVQGHYSRKADAIGHVLTVIYHGAWLDDNAMFAHSRFADGNRDMTLNTSWVKSACINTTQCSNAT